MPVTVLIFVKVVRKMPAIILTYEPFIDVLRMLNLDNKNNFFSRADLSNYFGVLDRWVKDGLKVSLFLGPRRRRSTCC